MLYDSIQLFEGSKLLNVVVDSGSSFPANPNSGELFFNTSTSALHIYTGSSWLKIGEDIVPSQTGQSGKYLTTNGTTLSWSTVDALPSQSTHSGKFLTTNGTSASWSTVDALPSQTGNSGRFLTTNGTAASWTTAVTSVGVSSSGTYSGALTIGSTPVTDSGTITITPNLFTSSAGGIVPASGGGTTNFLRADGTWAAAGGAGTVTSVGVTSSGTYASALTIASSPVTSSGSITITPNIFGSLAPGVVPSSGGGTANFLRADGTWATPPGTSSFSGGTVVNATTFSSTVGVTGATTISSTLAVVGATTFSSTVEFGTAYTETLTSITSTTTTSIDCSLGNNFSINLAADITALSFSNIPVAGRVYNLSLVIRQSATGGRSITWPNSIRWAGGVSPTITQVANKHDVISLMTNDGGTIWYGFIAGQNF